MSYIKARLHKQERAFCQSMNLKHYMKPTFNFRVRIQRSEAIHTIKATKILVFYKFENIIMLYCN